MDHLIIIVKTSRMLMVAALFLCQLLVIPNAVSQTGTVCAPGSFLGTNGTCYPCQSGTYTDFRGAVNCSSAAPGNYVAGTGAVAQTKCPAGTYQLNQGQSSCISCPVGWYQPSEGSATCRTGGSGYYVPGPGVGAIAAIACPAGTYPAWSGPGGMSRCQPCGAGQTSNAGNASRETCWYILYNSPADYFNARGQVAPGAKPKQPHKCEEKLNWNVSNQRCQR